MLPSQGKRKLQDDSNPLVAAAKRQKKESSAASTKRKLAGAEEAPGGLLIVRGSRASPAPFQSASQPVAGPSSSNPLTTAKPPSKKLRANSLQPTSQSTTSKYRRANVPAPDHEIDNDVRAMEDEADHLRRQSRARQIDTALLPNSSIMFSSPVKRASSVVPTSQHDANSRNPLLGKGKGKARAQTAEPMAMVIDTTVPLPDDDTPQIIRNRRLREGALAGSRDKSTALPTTPENSHKIDHRRRSSTGRGKRISSSFANTGVITQPHNSVSDSSFYKHIDVDLPDSERLRQLLIWCASRAGSSYTNPSPPAGTSSSSKNKAKSKQPPLPPLSEAAAAGFKKVQDDVIRMLAEKRIDLSVHSGDTPESSRPTKENAQNVTNRKWEVIYKGFIDRSSAEDEAWKKVSYSYESYARNVRSSIEKRRTALAASSATATASASTTQDDPSPTPPTPSAKAKGKQRAEPASRWAPREAELSASSQRGLALAKSILGTKIPHNERPVGPAASTSHTPSTDASSHPGETTEQEIRRRLGDLEFKLDFILTRASAVKTMVDTAEEMLDVRFAVLGRALSNRGGASTSSLGTGREGSGLDVLDTYVRGTGPGSSGSGRRSPKAGAGAHDPMDLLRALARVDQERPPAMVGDAARRAAREVARIEESGIGAVGDRRLTGVPVGLATPRKMPGTPRRERTPGREKTPGRER